MITYLISTPEFVLKVREQLPLTESIGNAVTFTQLITKYAKFISQKPTLDMFIPCDEEGTILEEPTQLSYMVYIEKYIKAQSKVLFEGWKYNDTYETIINGKVDEILFLDSYKTIESIFNMGIKLKLTKKALEEIGLC